MYANQLINEAEVQRQWGPVITESTGIEDKAKLSWMSKYCHYHNLNESVYNTVHLNPNMNVQGMGAPALPGNPGAMNDFSAQTRGSGDTPASLLPLAMQVAAQTVGLDLVPVVPMQGPMGILTYLDFVYGGGRIAAAGGQAGNAAPLLVKVDLALDSAASYGSAFTVGDVVYTDDTAALGGASTGNRAAFELTFVGKSRIDGLDIFRVRANVTGATAGSVAFAQGGEAAGVAIYEAVASGTSFYSDVTVGTAEGTFSATPELVKALEDHITGFSGNAFSANNGATASSFTGIAGNDPMSRGVGESTPDNNMGLTLFNKSIAADTYQVAAAVTREQVQDLKQFGIDAVSQVEAVLVNELTQAINKLILDRIFRLGATNAQQVNTTQGVLLSASFGTGTTTTNASGFNLGPSNTSDSAVILGAGSAVTNVTGGGETQGSIQRRLMTKVLASSNLVATRGRRGPATFAVTGGKMATALQDVSGFVAYPMANTVNQTGGSLYPIGSIAGVTIYVDPNRSWDDLKIVVGRKGDGNSPGLVFMPYLMAESVETIAEGTMAPKIAVKSRFALVEAGFHPQTMYYTIDCALFDGVDII